VGRAKEQPATRKLRRTLEGYGALEDNCAPPLNRLIYPLMLFS